RRPPRSPRFPYTTLFRSSGPGDTPSRRAIFACYPQAATEARDCAAENLTRLATRAWRRPVDAESDEVAELVAFYDNGEALGGFRSEEHTSELQSRENLVC